MFKPIAILMMLALAAPAAAQNPPAAQQSAPAGAAKDGDPNRIICERQEETGSRLGAKKVCKTAADWQVERQQQRETLEGVQRQGTSTGTPSG